MEEIKNICTIIGSVPLEENPFEGLDLRNHLVICADGGYDNAAKFGIRPDLLIGDFDSVQNPLPDDIETVRLPVEKDDTDTFAATKEGLRRGCHMFEFFGVIGGARFDHSIASLSVLQHLSLRGCKAVIQDGSRQFFVLSGGRLTLKDMEGATLSVFPFGCASCEVSYTGLQYPLNHATLYSDVPLGVSNCIKENITQITLHNGCALVIVQQ